MKIWLEQFTCSRTFLTCSPPHNLPCSVSWVVEVVFFSCVAPFFFFFPSSAPKDIFVVHFFFFLSVDDPCGPSLFTFQYSLFRSLVVLFLIVHILGLAPQSKVHPGPSDVPTPHPRQLARADRWPPKSLCHIRSFVFSGGNRLVFFLPFLPPQTLIPFFFSTLFDCYRSPFPRAPLWGNFS